MANHRKGTGKKSQKDQKNSPLKSPEGNGEPSASTADDVNGTMILEPSVTLLELFEPPSAPTKKVKTIITKEVFQIIKKEDEKYKGINFNVPPANWTKEEKSQLRKIMREITLAYKRASNKDRIKEIGHQMFHFSLVEKLLTRDIMGLLQKDINLMDYLKLKHLVFPNCRGKYDWEAVSKFLDYKHTPAECEEFWYMELYPKLQNTEFSPADEELLMQLAIENNFQNWDKICKKIEDHSEYQCYVHFRRNLFKQTILRAHAINILIEIENI